MRVNTYTNIEKFSRKFGKSLDTSSCILGRLNAGGEENSPVQLTKEFSLPLEAKIVLTNLIMGMRDEESKL